ncbi:hypothetical protein [Marinobacter sp. Hex_13]|uniref:hypothetical protein n=1 Tax=Marinobacter sp. Hex_13 TaxID=1795866 RepID=UPI0007942C81|nr:hypothetical protein [Marinobacter sp. Hex_13]KXJ45859.1 MAG: hypothetical protein AXW11_12270 [Marinobacter sp. Hex_13]
MTDKEIADLVDKLYSGILHTANLVLRNCSNFHITILQKENPSYDEVANHLEKICQVLEVLADEDGDMTAQKARDYAMHVKQIAAAIVKGDESELQDQLDQLTRRSFL